MRRLLTAALLALAAPAAAQPVAPAVPVALAEYQARRDSLAARLGDGVVVAFGAREPVAIHQSFRQLPGFAYLTSFAEPDAVLVLRLRGGRATGSVFVQVPDARYQLYVGIPADSAAVARETGLARRDVAALRPALDSLARAGVPFHVIRDVGSGDAAGRDTVTLGASFVRDLQRAHPALVVRDAAPALDRLRARKSPAELALLRRAIAATDSAHAAALRAVRPGAVERQVQGAIEAAFVQHGAEGPSFASIVGSGPNATTLHYMRNDRTMRAGEVVVMDVGASFGGYAADVTRTVPVSGRFTPEQRAVYQIVRDAQTAAERAAKVGAPWAAAQAAADSVVARGLARLGLIEGPDAEFDAPWAAQCAASARLCKQFALFLPHGLGHGIGLEVHDPAMYYYDDRTLRDGDVFTIEPGVYVNPDVLKLLPDTPRNRALLARVRPAVERYANTGVRIEDDFLVTTRGLERLSRAPREADEIEAAMARVRGVVP
ncbi:aminopeptidase P N-terminal domain-containing protein [Roseisolibacter sp. H3M3-2]|uniref:aminopeptidase P N-terminal domain-containing protein n=1 Tax=Roseisolibacter sp. H3M3-2 TaxID=3031323 RepID=UPI0023D98749|nr:aminopeptidase P N-terminal domain-containing protein [Roseisolibacter sp. H3M3-2]MDF1502734.1 aminopeptidase P N-terminal domain-containing protein [Roseisolibacter sp. H3M3-2]